MVWYGLVIQYNTLQDSTLAGHTDESEPYREAPLFSFSFGNSAIFMMGHGSKDDAATALYLQRLVKVVFAMITLLLMFTCYFICIIIF